MEKTVTANFIGFFMYFLAIKCTKAACTRNKIFRDTFFHFLTNSPSLSREHCM